MCVLYCLKTKDERPTLIGIFPTPFCIDVGSFLYDFNRCFGTSGVSCVGLQLKSTSAFVSLQELEKTSLFYSSFYK